MSIQEIPNSYRRAWSKCCKQPIALGGNSEHPTFVCTGCNKSSDIYRERHGEDGRVIKRCINPEHKMAYKGKEMSVMDWEKIKDRTISEQYFYCDLCNPPKKDQSNQSWEKEFDEKFSTYNLNDSVLYNGRMWYAKDILKEFISQLLIDQKREWIEEKKREINSWRYSYDNYPTMMIDKESFEKGGLARELAQELIKSLEE